MKNILYVKKTPNFKSPSIYAKIQNMSEKFIYLIVIVLVIIIELLIKKSLSGKEFSPKQKGIFIMPTVNTGFLYSLARGKNGFAKILCTIILVLCITFFFIYEVPFLCGIGISLILGGGASNTLDRFLRKGVLDYIAIKRKNKITIYNLADFCIFCGGIIVIISYII